jgi:hypothetical protein
MTYVLSLCVFMSTSGWSCTDIQEFPTIDACIEEADKRKGKEKRNEMYQCEGRTK